MWVAKTKCSRLQSWWLVSNRNFFLQLWRLGNPKWRCWQIRDIVRTCFLVCRWLSFCYILEWLGQKGWEILVGSLLRSLTLTIKFHPSPHHPKTLHGASTCVLWVNTKYPVYSGEWTMPCKTKKQQQHGNQN